MTTHKTAMRQLFLRGNYGDRFSVTGSPRTPARVRRAGALLILQGTDLEETEQAVGLGAGVIVERSSAPASKPHRGPGRSSITKRVLEGRRGRTQAQHRTGARVLRAVRLHGVPSRRQWGCGALLRPNETERVADRVGTDTKASPPAFILKVESFCSKCEHFPLRRLHVVHVQV